MNDKKYPPKGEMKQCPICQVPVRLDRVESHVEKVHKRPKKELLICPICKALVSPDNIERHIKKLHLIGGLTKPSPGPALISIYIDVSSEAIDRIVSELRTKGYLDDKLVSSIIAESIRVVRHISAISGQGVPPKKYGELEDLVAERIVDYLRSKDIQVGVIEFTYAPFRFNYQDETM